VSFAPAQARPLAPLTSLGLGGAAKYFVEVDSRPLLLEALRWAARGRQQVGVLGGGSNLVVGDAGFDGLVVRIALRGIELVPAASHVLLTAQAGVPWEEVVQTALAEGLGGLECLTGIPGSTGATPIQNVGAYGQEVSDTIDAVEVLDRSNLETIWFDNDTCGFGYRSSRFKQDPERYVVLAVRYRLTPGAAPCLRYGELARALGSRAEPSLQEVATAVRSLRASKGMLLEGAGENRRSAGSFFTNPIVTTVQADALRELALSRGLVSNLDQMPCFEAGPGRKKLSAAWLIEHAGIKKGTRRGQVGVSSQHALALVHHGGGTTAELLALASEVEAGVQAAFGIALTREPVCW
jgi:UDP-N-acetylmuramate dehydrogenase